MLFLIGGWFGSMSAATMASQEAVVSENLAPRSQTSKDHAQGLGESAQQDPSTGNKQDGASFVIAPLPISSPALGSGIVPVFAYIFPLDKADKTSTPSVIGAAGLITDNGTRGFALAGELYFKEDSYRVTAAFARGNLNYDLYGLGAGSSQSSLPLNQTGQVLFAEFLRRLGWKFFLGPRFLWGSSLITVQPADPEMAPLPPDVGLHTALTAVGFRLQRDTRPNRFYPTSGTLLDLTSDFFSQGLGSKYSFQSYKFTFNKYWSVAKQQVLAYNALACVTAGTPPFYGNCIYGTNNELRGYIAGRYLDRYMMATQLEYRLALPKRFGAVAFGGLGGVIPGGNQPFRTKNFLPSGGGGARFELSKKYHVNLRADFAQGKDSHTWSIGVGEAF
ncbi:MAG TPA: BamA/TamA family outer membrane protein [Candidatus Solibacter sp.]|nr:BamA/TamA family outer membrane protein [Candidatus Solibacter sp.]